MKTAKLPLIASLLLTVSPAFVWVRSAAAYDGALGPVEAYASATSVAPGQQISFYARDSQGTSAPRTVALSFFKVGASAAVLSTSTSLTQQTVPANASTDGCGWPAVNITSYGTALTIPSSWSTGLYYADFDSGNSTATQVYFVVKTAVRHSNIVFQVEFLTAQAYNNYGGKSLYAFNSTHRAAASHVSFDRPICQTLDCSITGGGWGDESAAPILEIVPWLQQNGIAVDYVSSVDLNDNPELLNGYQLFITVGHDEYWTMAMRQNVDGFVHNGGNAAFLSGNTSFWQARLQPAVTYPYQADRVLVCYRSTNDPIARTNPRLTTTNFYASPVNYPENRSMGLGTRAGGEQDDYRTSPTPYVVHNADHWVFANTGLANGSSFGGNYVGYEVDALHCRGCSKGILTPDGDDGSPLNFQILGLAATHVIELFYSLRPGWAMFGLFDHGGTVFNAGSVAWASALGVEPNISQITKNVLTTLGASKTPLQRATLSVYQYHAIQQTIGGWKFSFTTDPFLIPRWSYDGPAFYALSSRYGTAVNVYRYYASDIDGNRFAYSTDPNLGDGWEFDGTAFYAYPTQVADSVPVYQYHAAQPNGWRFLYSTNDNVGLGWTLDGPVFYVPASR